MKKRSLLYIALFVIFALGYSAYSQENNISSLSDKKIDEKIMSQLQTDYKVPVIVMLEDTHNVFDRSSNSPQQDYSDFREYKKMVESQQNKILNKLNVQERNILSNTVSNDNFILKIKFSAINGFAGNVTKNGLNILESDSSVKKVYFDYEVKSLLSTSGPLINAPSTHSIVLGDANITGKYETVCVVDSGIDYTHDNLGQCSRTNNINDGTCSKVIGGYDFVNDDYDPFDDFGHGSFVSGIIISNHSSLRGIAPDAKIVAVKVLSSSGGGFSSDVAAAIDWCINNATKLNISAISISLGRINQDGTEFTSGTACDDNDIVVEAANQAASKGIFVFAASGNDGVTNGIGSPACGSKVIGVGGVNRDDNAVIFNRGPNLNLIAPAYRITSTFKGNSFFSASGTSAATPHAAAASVLLNQFIKLQNGTGLSPKQMVFMLNKTGKRIQDGSSQLNFSRIDVFRALLLLDVVKPNITLVAPTPSNNSSISDLSFIINLTSNEVLSSIFLEFNKSNETINATSIALNWMSNKTVDSFGTYQYRIYANDSAGNMRITQTFQISISNTAPIIRSFYPLELNASIGEPNNLTFNISYFDADGDRVVVRWFQDGMQKSTSNNFLFVGNYTSAGLYNITVIATDGNSAVPLSWNLTVNNTNIAPAIISVNITNSDLLNRTNGSLIGSWSFFDLDQDSITDNETKWYNNSKEVASLKNLTIVPPDKTTKGDNWTFSINVFDGIDWSGFFNSTVLNIRNSRASLALTGVTEDIKETEFAVINFTMSDLDNDPLNLAISNANFIKTIVNNITSSDGVATYFGRFTWQTGLNDSGQYFISINANDVLEGDDEHAVILVLDANDLDNDGNPDFNDSDDDNDGINDSEDTLIGNSSYINTSITNLVVEIDNSAQLSRKFNETSLVKIKDINKTIIEFSFNFSNSILDMRNLSIDIQANSTNGFTITNFKGIPIVGTKTLYVDNVNNLTTLCVKDEEITSIAQISSLCNGADEFGIKCPGTANNEKYNCIFGDEANKTFKISGLIHSGIQQQSFCGDGIVNNGESCSNCPADAGSCPTSSGSSTSGGGGGSGGGGSGGGGLVYVCNQDWQCDQWTDCVDGFQTRKCNFVKAAQHAQESACPAIGNAPVSTQKCEIPQQNALALETCNDGIKNQNEDNVDCGGVCKLCQAENNSISSASIQSKEMPATGFAVKDIAGGKISPYIIATLVAAIFAFGMGFMYYKRKQ